MHLELSTGVGLHVRDQGRGAPTYLLIHGWAVSGAVWDSLAQAWPDDAGRLLIPDLRGAGFSSKPRTGYTLPQYAADVIEIIDRLELTDVVLVGHSMGGTIAQWVALERQAQLRALVLVSPVPASGVPLDAEQLAFFRSLGSTRAGAQQVLSIFMAHPPDDAAFETLVRDGATVAREAFLEAFDAWRTADFAGRLGELRVPTLVLAGADEQPLTPDILQAAVADLIPGARLDVIEHCGHYAQVEATEALLRHLLVAGRD
jgi:pimeloyl-ACP methyl ester carboxylesterase